MNKSMLSMACILLALTAPVAVRAEVLTPDAIIALSKTGIGDEAIIAKIKAEGTVFELTTDQMIGLRQQGVSSPVIAAMLSNRPAEQPLSLDSPDPAVRHAPGLYLLTSSGDTARMQRIDATVSNQAKTGGILGYALTGGLASASVKVVIPQETARTQATPNPRFYFYFDESTGVVTSSSWASGMNMAANSPAEFSLIRLSRKAGRREAKVGSMNIAGAKSGVMDRDRLPYEHRMLRAGVYEVNIPQPLTPGEYGFIFAMAGNGTAGAMTARIFDFSVQ